MTQAADIVQALVERATRRPPLERSTGMPYGWALWLRALPPAPARPQAEAGEVVALLAQQASAPAPRGEELGTWPAFFSLFRAGWLPASRDERPLRWASQVGSLVLHLVFLAFLAWVAWMQSLHLPVPPEEDGEGERIAIGFVGAGDPGTPQDDAHGEPGDAAGGPPPSAAVAAEPDAMAADAAEASPRPPRVVPGEIAPSQLPPPPALSHVAVREIPEPAEPQPPAEQPVQVTEVERPTVEFVLPPTTPRTIDVPLPAERQVREREVAVVEAPQVRMPQPRPVDIPVRQLRDVEMEVRARAIDDPLPRVQVQPVAVRSPQTEVTLPGTPDASVRQREVPMPVESAPAAGAPPAADEATGASLAAAAGVTGAAASDVGQDRVPGQAAMQAPGAAAATTSIPSPGSGQRSPLAGDDWGQARDGAPRPGGASGLFDGQGRVRLAGEGSGAERGAGDGSGPPGAGVAGRGAPGGDSDAWSRERFEKSGTWLKRPPYDYEPTSFDRYWVPNDSLLAEWVRKGMKTVAIPIPGTGKKINCVISLLQVGGGCGIVDPDLDLQPAEGRPPPDIPFKPELQEDNGSVRP